MEISIQGQTLAFIESILYGTLLGLFFDFFRLSRKVIKNAFLVAFEDILFLFICTLVTFSFILRVSDGQVRAFLILGEILGFIIYCFSLSIIFMKLSNIIFKIIKTVFKMIWKIFFIPIWKILSFFGHILHPLWKKISKIMKKIALSLKFRLKNASRVMYNVKNKRKSKITEE